MESAHTIRQEPRWITTLLRGLVSTLLYHCEGFVPAAMTRRSDGPTRKCKVLHDAGSSQWLLAMPYSQRRCTKDSFPNTVRAIQMGHDADGTNKCASNGYADNE